MSLKFILSPAKKMNVVEGPPYAQTQPKNLDLALKLAQILQDMSASELQSLWQCSDKILQQNLPRIARLSQTMSTDPSALTAAILSYEGIQYQHLNASVMDDRQLKWMNQHVYIVSGLYGALRPFDGITPYRLEMQARLQSKGCLNLYQFWNKQILQTIISDDPEALIVNVASKEYAKAVVPHAKNADIKVVSCLFGTINPKTKTFKQKSTESKEARGSFVRWCAERQVSSVQELRAFNEKNYHLASDYSKPDTLIFVHE